MKLPVALLLALLSQLTDSVVEFTITPAFVISSAKAKEPEKVKATPKRPRKHILAIVGPPKTCAPCERFKNGPAKLLEKAGWGFGPECHIEYVVSTEDVCQKYGVNALPTFILMEGDNEVGRREGYIDQWEIGRLWKSKPTK